jgi:Peptidase family M28
MAKVENADKAGTEPQPKARLFSRGGLITIGAMLAFILLAGVTGCVVMVSMPGYSFKGDLPELNEREAEFHRELNDHLGVLINDIGERHVGRYDALCKAADYIEKSFKDAGLETVRHPFIADGKEVCSIEATVRGSAKTDEIIVVGAHYDTAWGSPGADDNGSAVAALLVLAKAIANQKPERTVRFVAFPNEEPPYFQTDQMGSLVYARACRERGDKIACMICLESLGYYSDEPDSQKYPVPILGWVYPTRGNFIAFVGNIDSRSTIRRGVGAFREVARLPSEGAAMPRCTPGVDLSDHWSFWQAGYPAFMVTNTAMYRNPNYHTSGDNLASLDIERLARATLGLEATILKLAEVE